MSQFSQVLENAQFQTAYERLAKDHSEFQNEWVACLDSRIVFRMSPAYGGTGYTAQAFAQDVHWRSRVIYECTRDDPVAALCAIVAACVSVNASGPWNLADVVEDYDTPY